MRKSTDKKGTSHLVKVDLPPPACAVPPVNSDDYIEIPVNSEYDHRSEPIGWLRIRRDALYPIRDIVLAPGIVFDGLLKDVGEGVMEYEDGQVSDFAILSRSNLACIHRLPARKYRKVKP